MRFQHALEFEQGFVIEHDAVERRRLPVLEAEPDRICGKGGVVPDSGESFLLGGPEQAAVFDQGCRTVMIVCRNTQDCRHGDGLNRGRDILAEPAVNRVWLLRAVSVVIGLSIALVASELLLGVYRNYIASAEKMDTGFIRYDANYGWKLSPGWSGRHRHYDYEARYSVDHRSMRHCPAASGSGRRVLVLGDSYTFGLGVNDAETFSCLISATRTDIDLVNAGVPGYAPDQEMLWLRDARELFVPDLVVWVLFLGNDLIDTGREFPVQAPYAKPFAQLNATGRLEIRNQPVVRSSAGPAVSAGRGLTAYLFPHREKWYERWRIYRLIEGSVLFAGSIPDQRIREAVNEKVPLFSAVLDDIRKQSRGRLKLVLLPGASVITSPGTLAARYQLVAATILVGIAGKEGIPVTDLTPVLQAHRNDVLYYAHDGHLTARGHRVVATALEGVLGDS